MRSISPAQMIAIGFIMVLVGVVIPFLMVTRIVEPGFLLVFVAYIASLGGLILGIIGAALYRRENEDRWWR